jgi:biopolymer transport protein ExbD
MKFPRNARIFRGQLDAAPFAGVFFLLVLFLLLNALTPQGVPLKLPTADNLPPPKSPTLSIAVDANGRLYSENRSLGETELTNKLARAVKETSGPLTLILQADEAVPESTMIHIWSLARQAGISELVLATLPRPFASPSAGRFP